MWSFQSLSQIILLFWRKPIYSFLTHTKVITVANKALPNLLTPLVSHLLFLSILLTKPHYPLSALLWKLQMHITIRVLVLIFPSHSFLDLFIISETPLLQDHLYNEICQKHLIYSFKFSNKPVIRNLIFFLIAFVIISIAIWHIIYVCVFTQVHVYTFFFQFVNIQYYISFRCTA